MLLPLIIRALGSATRLRLMHSLIRSTILPRSCWRWCASSALSATPRHARLWWSYRLSDGDRRPKIARHHLAQNIAAYDVALGPTWDARKAFWKDPEPNREILKKNLLSFEAARARHVGTSPNSELYDPNSWNDEFAMLNRPGMAAIQTTLFYDYRNNVAAYPQWQGGCARINRACSWYGAATTRPLWWPAQ